MNTTKKFRVTVGSNAWNKSVIVTAEDKASARRLGRDKIRKNLDPDLLEWFESNDYTPSLQKPGGTFVEEY